MSNKPLHEILSLLAIAAFTANGAVAGTERPAGYWSETETREILGKTVELRLAPDLEELTAAEQTAVEHLLAAGELMHALYLEQTHHQSLAAREALLQLQDAADLHTLFRLFRGPIATTPENARVPFLPVDGIVPGKNVYPWGIERRELDAFMRTQPDGALLDGRTVVRRASADNAKRDLAVLARYPVLDALQPGLRNRLQAISRQREASGFYALPYSVVYAERLMPVHDHLRAAADAMRETDGDFAAYLEHRARDLLANNYEAGDAAWVRGEFGKLNAQIGSYETYDDELYGTKTFFSMSVLLKDAERSRAVREAIGDIQAIENSLPYGRHKRVRSDIPVGVYQVIADFGQARGTNTATILPNDADHARKYGRVILLRHNILTNPALFADTKAAWNAAVDDAFESHLTLDAGFQRTLWHEIGHYLGAASDERGRSLDVALEEYSDLMEEIKADLVALYAAPQLHENGYYSDAALRSLYADGIRRTLQAVKPRRDQPYQTMQLMQMNWFLERGALSFANGVLHIHYDKYHDAVRELLREVLAIQSAGDANRAARFVDRYAQWDEKLHGVIAANIRKALKYRYRVVYYDALGE